MIFTFEGKDAILVAAFGTSAELWAGMQLQYDLHQAQGAKRPKIERIAA